MDNDLGILLVGTDPVNVPFPVGDSGRGSGTVGEGEGFIYHGICRQVEIGNGHGRCTAAHIEHGEYRIMVGDILVVPLAYVGSEHVAGTDPVIVYMLDLLGTGTPPVEGFVVIGLLCVPAGAVIIVVNRSHRRIVFFHVPVSGKDDRKISRILAGDGTANQTDFLGVRRAVDAWMGIQKEELRIRRLIGHNCPSRCLRYTVFHFTEFRVSCRRRVGMPDSTGTVEGDKVCPVEDGAGFLAVLRAGDKAPVTVVCENILAVLAAKAIVAIAAAIVFYIPHLLFLRFLQADYRRTVVIDHGVICALAVCPVAVAGVGVVGLVAGRCETDVGRHNHHTLGNGVRCRSIGLGCEGVHFCGQGIERRVS